jgi:sugar transferase (PEP-CTERM/EpsH1 system associated)
LRILYLAHRIPDAPTKGDKIRSFHQLRALVRHHEVHVFALDDGDVQDAVEPAWKQDVASLTVLPLSPWGARRRALGAVVSGQSLSAAHFAEPVLRQGLQRALRERAFDVAVVYSGAMDPLLQGFRPRLVDLVDVDSAKFAAYYHQRTVRGARRLAFGLEGRRLQALEQQIVQDADLSMVCTAAEAKLLRSFTRPRRLEVLENGVDTEVFAQPLGNARRADEIVFVGALDYQANVDAVAYLAQELLPLIRRQRPAATLTVVGRSPVAEVHQLAQLEGVELVADAPSVLPYLHRASVTLLPFRIARGIQNKALEALSSGLPVVLSAVTAQGLAGAAGRDYLVGENADELVSRTCQVLAEPDLQRSLAQHGRTLVEEHYAWPRLLARFEQLVREARQGTVQV